MFSSTLPNPFLAWEGEAPAEPWRRKLGRSLALPWVFTPLGIHSPWVFTPLDIQVYWHCLGSTRKGSHAVLLPIRKIGLDR